MPARRTLSAREVRWAAALLVLFLLVGALGSLIFAIQWLPGLSHQVVGSMQTLRGNEVTVGWPSRTPHELPWPAPNYWHLTRGTGRWFYQAQYREEDGVSPQFAMELTQAGWPVAAVQRKLLWWDESDPALQDVGREGSSPGTRIRPLGLLINTLAVGGAAWLLLVGLPLTTLIAYRRLVRASRKKHARCLGCGYEIDGLDKCPECGREVQSSRTVKQ
jgi:hypothetical protein